MKIGERLLIIKERSIYEFMFADAVDPQRTNIDLPSNIHKLIINQGTESEIVGRCLLTAKTLFKQEFFENTISCIKLMELALELLEEFAVLESEINNFLTEENNASESYKNKTGGSYSIPTLQNLETKCKTIFQKADHIEQILMEMITVFYPNDGLTKQSHFPKFLEVIKQKYGDQDPFVKFISQTLDFMKVIRSLRNALDHRLNTVSVKNYELQPDSTILSPTIELKHKEESLEQVSLSAYLPSVIANLLFVVELTMAYLAEKNSKKGPLNHSVREIPEKERRNKFMKHAFWSAIGQGGYYHQ